MADREPTKWITVNGKHVPIYEDGDSKVTAKTHKDLVSELKKRGYELDSADNYDMEHSNNLNGEKVTLYDKDDNEYTATYNKYSDGGREIINIKKTPTKADKLKDQINKEADEKEKQIARNKAEKDELNKNEIKDYSVSKSYISSGRKRSSQAEYSIKVNGKTLHNGAAKVIFLTQKEVEDFIDSYNTGKVDTKKYRWI